MSTPARFEIKVPNDPLLPLSCPPTDGSSSVPQPSSLPPRPSRCPASEPFADLAPSLRDWEVVTHCFPAAWPRTTAWSTQPYATPDHRPPPKMSQEQIKAETERLWRANLDSPRPAGPSQPASAEPRLWIAVNQYRRKRSVSVAPSGQGFTLVLAHANGFHKETWEPSLVSLLCSPSGDDVDEIWSLDAINQGDSALLNRGMLGDVFDWADYGRDLLQFILSYLPAWGEAGTASPAGASSTPAPTNLTEDPSLTPAAESPPFVLPSIDLSRQDFLSLDASRGRPDPSIAERGWRGRRLVLVGHSAGGTATIFAATSIPRLLTGVFIVDPVLNTSAWDRSAHMIGLGSGALARRDRWPSRAEARDAFMRKAMFKRWDSTVLDRYVDFGLSQEPAGAESVLLKCAPLQEAAVFIDPHGRSAHAYRRLRDIGGIQQDCGQLVLAEPQQSVLPEFSIEQLSAEVPWLPMTRVEGSAHLITQEKPREIGRLIAEYLRKLKSPKSKL